MIATLISALAAIVASAGAIVVAKGKEREAVWRAKKLAYYGDFFKAVSGVVGDKVPVDSQASFASASTICT